MALFTPEELEELRRADAELDEEFVQTQEEIEASRTRDKMARLDRLDSRSRKIAENQRAYREANRENYNEYMRNFSEKEERHPVAWENEILVSSQLITNQERKITMKNYTLPELAMRVDREWFTVTEISGVLNADPQTIRITARQRPELLGFPVIVSGNRVKVPRIPFLRFMGVSI